MWPGWHVEFTIPGPELLLSTCFHLCHVCLSESPPGHAFPTVIMHLSWSLLYPQTDTTQGPTLVGLDKHSLDE